ncbi:MAG: YcnI family protein [Nocardioidaceae bacterium]
MTVILTVLALTVLAASPASAHVAISPATAPAGSAAELTFRVPNEEAHAATTKLVVQLPVAHPIAQLLVRPIPGWSSTVRTRKLTKPLVTDDGSFSSVVSLVTWSGGRISPGQYQDFTLSADPLPDKPVRLVFKALQFYSNGDVVRWIDVPVPGLAEPEHPAPVLTVTAPTSTQSGTKSGTQSGSSASESMPGMSMPGTSGRAATGSQAASTDGPGAVAWVALGVAVAALVVALVSARGRRKG